MSRESIFYFFVLLTFLYIIYKNSKDSLKILIILFFYSGLASYLGKNVENAYKVILVIFSLYILFKKNALGVLNRKEKLLLFIFLVFSASFLYSAFINGDYFNLTFSQYGKFVTPICIFYVLNRLVIKRPIAFLSMKQLFFSLLKIQILLTGVKFFTLGMQESTVGSVAYIGGGPATMLPVLGYILLWIDRKGDLKRNDWIFTLFLFLIGIVSHKRAIIFIMPVFIFLFMYYVPRNLKIRYLVYTLPLLPLIFYIGVRLNPTLNREQKVGGSFDLKYVLNYTKNYSFGESSIHSGSQAVIGRGGATLLLFEKLFNRQALSFKDYWGSGLRDLFTTNYEEFDDKNYEVNSKGSVTGVFQSYISSGFVGVALTIILMIIILLQIKETRIRNTIAALMFWDYLFYSGLILRTQSLFILLFFIIIYSNLHYDQDVYKKFLPQSIRGYKNRSINMPTFTAQDQ